MKKNLSLQTIFQIISVSLPLITSPYLSRVLGADNLGIFSYTTSLVSYFTLFAMLGTVNYGTKCIAEVGEDKELRSKTFFEIYCFQVFMGFLSFIAYLIFVLFAIQNNKLISIIQVLALVACFFDITWLFFGVEDFSSIVIKSLIIKIVTVLCIFLFVNDENDLWIYTIIMVGGTLLNQLILWLYAHKYIEFIKIDIKNIFYRIKPNLLLFVPLLAMSIYHSMDKTMLGLLSSYEESGFYYNVDKIINIPLCIITGIGTVMLPRMASLYNDNYEEGKKLFDLSIELLSILSVGMTFGIASIANEFIPIFFGKGYESCVSLCIILSPVLVLKSLSNTVRMQYLVPLNKDRIFIESVVVGSITNLIINFLLIAKYGALGAVIGTLAAELTSCLWQFFKLKKFLNVKKYFINIIVYVFIGITMFFCVRGIAYFSINNILKIFLEIFVGCAVYIILTFLFLMLIKDEVITMIFSKLKSFIKRFKVKEKH